METLFLHFEGLFVPLFKSYYVVWKLKIKFPLSIFFVEFKSYYVVWKLDMIFLSMTLHLSFKSYYVVWKLHHLLPLHHLLLRLNRTM